MQYLQRSELGVTQREARVADLLMANLQSKEIAQTLNISRRTVEGHRLSLRRKLGLGPDESLAARLNNSPTEQLTEEALLRQRLYTLAPDLTPMEAKVSLLVYRGQQSRAIAALLGISPRTIEDHRSKIRGKLALGRGCSLMAAVQNLLQAVSTCSSR